jgi:hypothetical protein
MQKGVKTYCLYHQLYFQFLIEVEQKPEIFFPKIFADPKE